MGKNVRKQFAHQLPTEQIHQRVLSIAEQENESGSGSDKINFTRNGEQYRLHGSYSGFSVEGRLSITAKQITIEIELPLLARMFQSKVEAYIDQQAHNVLSSAAD
ncbi:MAG: hypothetical protein HON68_01570 [Gammaproteobacteria bacterium]|jgi:hypothetical protein|nr:hypothetical protein [Gammaproteobacteria bacterium]MBT3488322.1 hypothetical protein [Gammaproteobacteria bacterium]MBT3719745.1 hypothetical protein [Gammaproteobacteria bacterium]MBT3844861.1 hypothetical protein [Gammaproteobacteria bacterium]MBT3894430.1 hypothetical protein [Gammaproteobacteria bacterium]